MTRRVIGVMLALSAGAWAAGPPVPLAQKIDIQLRRPGLGFTGVHVVQVASGTVLYKRNEDRLFLPASNLKLLTSALALERLKPEYRYRTRVVVEDSGDLVLVGAGDPSFSGRMFPFDKGDHAQPSFSSIEALADQIVLSGVERVNGDIAGDDRLYPWAPYPASWTADDANNDYGAPVSALTWNDNVIGISLHAAEQAGEPAAVELAPALEVLTIENRVITTARGTRRRIHLERIAGSNRAGFSQWRITGQLPVGAVYSELIPVDDPALYAASALYDALVRRGVAIAGAPVARHRSAADAYVSPVGREVSSRTSPPLNELLQVMNKVSNNLYAEMFLREAARASGAEATTPEGARQLSAFLMQAGNPATDYRVDDGSGLSRNDLVTPRLLTRLLTARARADDRDAWIALLPIGGEDGTLEKRLCCVSQGRQIQAKTGSLDRVAALSGYAQSRTYGLLAFSILLNDFAIREAEAKQMIDKIALALIE